MPLGLTKVAVGCRSLLILQQRQAGRVEDVNGVSVVVCATRNRPKRADELPGGSIYWIIKHALIARQTILDIVQVDSKRGKSCHILLSPEVVPVLAVPLRAHQGWRYLDPANTPPDLANVGGDLGEMPSKLMRDLTRLGLI